MNTKELVNRKPNIPALDFSLPHTMANGIEVKRSKKVELDFELDKKRELDSELELELQLEIDDDELELGAGIGRSKPRNIVEKLELARLKRAIDRGEKLSPEEADRLGDIKSPVAKKLLERNEELSKPKGFTLSPMKALIRGL